MHNGPMRCTAGCHFHIFLPAHNLLALIDWFSPPHTEPNATQAGFYKISFLSASAAKRVGGWVGGVPVSNWFIFF